jgi:hypothetical protein
LDFPCCDGQQHGLVQAQTGHGLLQLAVLLFEPTHRVQFRRANATVVLAPYAEGRVCDAHLQKERFDAGPNPARSSANAILPPLTLLGLATCSWSGLVLGRVLVRPVVPLPKGAVSWGRDGASGSSRVAAIGQAVRLRLQRHAALRHMGRQDLSSPRAATRQIYQLLSQSMAPISGTEAASSARMLLWRRSRERCADCGSGQQKTPTCRQPPEPS